MAKPINDRVNNRLIIVDISSFIFRAFYAIRQLNSPDGTPVNAVHGVLQMLLKLLSKYRPSHLILARDLPGGTFRNELYPEYKANRSAPPEELVEQFPLVEALIEKMKILAIAIKGYEADDIIASIAVQFGENFDEVLIATSDKDLMQLVDGNIKVLDTMKDKTFEREDVFEKMGVYPEQIVDYLSLVGDSSDNIPGMKGIGAKGASKLLAEYKTLDGCIANKEKFTNKRVVNAFANHIDDAFMSKKLIEIVRDLDLQTTSDGMKFTFYPDDELFSFLDSLGFKNLVMKIKNFAYIDDQLGSQQGKQKKGEKSTLKSLATKIASEVKSENSEGNKLEFDSIVAKSDRLGVIFNEISMGNSIAIYPLWNSYSIDDRFERKLLGIAVANKENKVVNFPLQDVAWGDCLEEGQINKLWQVLFQNPKLELVVHDWKQFVSYAIANDLTITSKFFDLSIAHYCLIPAAKHDLNTMANTMLGVTLQDFDPRQGDLFDRETVPNILGERGVSLFKLYEKCKKDLELNGLQKAYYEMDLPLIEILAKMEGEGVHLNVPYFQELQDQFTEKIEEIEKQISAYTNDEEINLRSPKQVSHLLYNILELPIIKKTKTGASTNSEVLTELDSYYESEVPGLILQYREYDKLLSTYIKTFPRMVNEKSKKLHTHFNQIMAATGRLSSDHPNLQNIPVRSANGRLLRKGFIATPGNILFSADYSQVELRIVAHMSEDETMIKAFNNGVDIHQRTASEVFDIPVDQVTKEQRSNAKAVNFGLMYGQSAFGLSQSLHIPRGEAQEYINNYFKRFHRVRAFLDSLKESCEELGYAETMFGRRRVLSDINSTNRTMKSMAERVAINSPIQGTAADIIKIAMINVDKSLAKENLKSKMILQVHDELIFDVVEDELSAVKELVQREMEGAVKLKIPLKVDMGIGVNWHDLK